MKTGDSVRIVGLVAVQMMNRGKTTTGVVVGGSDDCVRILRDGRPNRRPWHELWAREHVVLSTELGAG